MLISNQMVISIRRKFLKSSWLKQLFYIAQNSDFLFLLSTVCQPPYILLAKLVVHKNNMGSCADQRKHQRKPQTKGQNKTNMPLQTPSLNKGAVVVPDEPKADHNIKQGKMKGFKRNTVGSLKQSSLMTSLKQTMIGIELRSTLLNKNLPEEDLESELSEVVSELFEEFDNGQKGFLSYSDFSRLMSKSSKKRLSAMEMKKVFQMTDNGKQRVVDKIELFSILDPRKI